ncbi:MAG TPA: MlaD family protein [Fibrobacteria bacterium]|nr:MlaD family protein [Fibrobacteria bacterium]HOX50868.1 MlaD family protein [Fibrobacteria bacterium]
MRKKIAGAFVLTALLVVVFLMARSLRRDDAPRVSFHTDSTTMLGQGSLVRFNGVKIGTIENTAISRNGLTLTARLEMDIDIPKNSRIHEAKEGLLGESSLQIDASGDPGGFYSKGHTIEMEPLRKATTPILTDILSTPAKMDTIITILRRIEDAKNVKTK